MPLVGGLAGLLFGCDLRLGLDPAQRHRLRDDLAGPRRAGRLERADPARLLRRRGGHHRQPHQAVPHLRLELRAADPGLLPDRRLVPALRVPDVRAHPHAARPHVQRRARQSGARAVRRLRPAAWCASSRSASRASSPASRAALAAINFEIANSALFSARPVGHVLLATFIGGAGVLRRVRCSAQFWSATCS